MNAILFHLIFFALSLISVLRPVFATPHAQGDECIPLCIPENLYGRHIASKLCSLSIYRADCAVQPCSWYRGRVRGFACSPLFTTPAPTPASTPSPTPSLSPLALLNSEPSFSDLTFRTGPLRRSTVKPSTDVGSQDMYAFSFNGTLNANGVVALDAAAALIDSVECSTEGSIRIRTLSQVTFTQSLSEMYPQNAVLVINRDLFGECILTDDEIADDEAVFDRSREFANAYLIIESVSGSPSDSTIQGTPAGFFALFDNASLSISRLPRSATNSTEITSLVRPFSLSAQVGVFSLGPLEVEAKLTASDSGTFDVLRAEWDFSGLDLEFQFTTDVTIEAELSAKIGIGLRLLSTNPFTFVSIPIYGIPEFSLFNDVDEGSDKWSLPSFKLGIFFEVPLVISIRGDVGVELNSKATGTYKLGRKKIVFFAKGPITNLNIGSREEVNEPASSSFSFTPPSPDEIGNSPAFFSVTAFVGIRPQIAAYAAILNLRLSGDAGVEIEATQAVTNSLPPLPAGSPLTVGQCETCHKIEIAANAVLGNVGIFAIIGLDREVNLFGRSFSIPLRTQFSLNLPGNPSLSSRIILECYAPEFGNSTVLCGEDECCDSEMQQCIINGNGEQQCSASVSPSPSPEPTPSSTPSDGKTSSVYTDPHLRTFDGLSYDCQASGEFILVRSQSLGLEIQARYSGPSPQGSVTKGLVWQQVGYPIVQMSITEVEGSLSTLVDRCPISLYVNGTAKNITETMEANGVTISMTSTVRVAYPSGVESSFRLRSSGVFGCYFESLQIFLPRHVVDTGNVIGLLGSPNNNFQDDWMTRAGEVILLPNSSTGRLFEPAYNYCTRNWCIRDKSESLFTYEQGQNHSTFDRCNVPFGTAVDFASASVELVSLCGEDDACLVDGLVGSLDDAVTSLQAQAEAHTVASQTEALRFEPAVMAVNTSVNVLITLNASRIRESIPDRLQSFILFRVDPITGVVEGEALVSLEDNGEAGFSDPVSGDGVFSNILAIESSTAGQTFGFRAVAVVEGAEKEDSPFSLTVPVAVRSYSRQSGIGEVVTVNSSSITVSNSEFNRYELVLGYSWGADQSDLDTGTQFLDGSVGFSCSSNPNFLRFSGDDTGVGGSEMVVISLNEARSQGLWNGSTTVRANAGWHISAGGSGPATLRTFLRVAESGDEVSGSGLSTVISPGSQFGCASTKVAAVKIEVGSGDTRVMLLPE
eukprot:TRINITY_DN816_c0_g1_i11.p1 TRINITY_DN816_c0_g1~~TRINITY_DN816_c0_g1_i11.p1  ORF type:complete len:1211 (-),score=140.56 TRINITY_DN816_c0_g1_i11:149-3781(-)